ncbi:Uncharacterized protein Mb2253c [Linum perenne]
MDRERDAFYVVRKGGMIGIYKSFPDSLAQVSDPSVSVFKGYGFPRAAEEYLLSNGIANAAYSVSATNVHNNLFGKLEPCSIQMSGLITVMENSQSKYPRLDNSESRSSAPISASPASLYFDGASKGNPGPAGAGAVLYSPDGKMVWRLCEGVGVATNNVAEYRGLLLGLKQALKRGLTDISVQGDSNLVCMQIQGIWKIKNKNLLNVGQEARELKERFRTFQIRHIPRVSILIGNCLFI